MIKTTGLSLVTDMVTVISEIGEPKAKQILGGIGLSSDLDMLIL